MYVAAPQGRVSRIGETLSRMKNGATRGGSAGLILYLCESVLVQKTLTELQGHLAPEGRSQCASRNGRNEEASQRYSEGRPVGLDNVRASAP